MEAYNAVVIAAFCIGQFVDNLMLAGGFVQIFFFRLAEKIHWLFSWCCAIGIKRILKFGFIYALYLAVVLAFDYLYMPWLGKTFRYFAVFPLYVSLFAISWLGLLLYKFFREKVFFLEEISEWLARESRFRLLNFFKKKANGNPRFLYILISIDWSPLHSYLYFKQGEADDVWEVTKSFALGSFYCAIFWGVVIDVAVFLWDILKPHIFLLWSMLTSYYGAW